MRPLRPPVSPGASPRLPQRESIAQAPTEPCESSGTPDDALVRATLGGSHEAFEELVRRHQSRVFATARRYARRESEVADIVQEVFLKAYERLPGFRFEAPFDHWLMRVAVRTCYDFLRVHQRTRELSFTDLTDSEDQWLERQRTASSEGSSEDADAARALVQRLLESLPPQFRLVIQLLEIEEKSIREIQQLTGWSIPLIKVRAFRARAAMRRQLARLRPGKYL